MSDDAKIMPKENGSLAVKGPSGLSYAAIAAVLCIVLAPVLSIAFWGTNVPFLS